MGEALPVVIVGAGQAGLAVSHELSAAGVEHAVLERSRVAATWRARWDSFCLVTPNWFIGLPDGAYEGPEPDGYLPRDELVAHIVRYAESFQAPVREGVEVTSIRPAGTSFALDTSDGPLTARIVVLATGAYQRPHRPAAADSLPPRLPVIDAEGYTNPGALPPGRVLIVGSGQTGCQLAEELYEAGRDVVLACGRAPWGVRRAGGVDFVRWGLDTGFLDQGPDSLPDLGARLVSNVQATGHGGGHDLHYRTLQALGVTLTGRLIGADGRRIRFAGDLAESVAFGDARYGEFCDLIRKLCAGRGIEAPELPEPPPFHADSPDSINLAGIGVAIFTSGFRPDYTRWVDVPGGFDGLGFPLQVEGASTVAPGLFFCGVHFMRKRKSTLLGGVGEDATVVAAQVTARLERLSA